MLALALIVSLAPGCGRVWAPKLSNEPKNLNAVTKPATVLIEGTITAPVTVPQPTIDQGKLVEDLTALMLSGQVDPYDTNAAVAAAFELIINDPLKYIVADTSLPPRVLDGVGYAIRGSGFIADPNGYVVTNAHVAAPDEKEIRSSIASIGLEAIIQEDIAAYQSSQGTVPDELLQGLLTADVVWTEANMEVGDVAQDWQVYMGAQIPGVAKDVKGQKAEVVAAGKAAPGKDVAVLKIPGKNLPTLPIGDDSQIDPGEKLFVMGYPGDVLKHPLLSSESIGEPTFNSGQCSGKKQSAEGFEVLQTDCEASKGNSGGPVIDENGKVVGLLTFGTIEEETGQSLAGMNFAMPASIINEYLDRAGAKPRESMFTKLYAEGLSEEAASHFKDALKVFEQIDGMSPGHPYVQQRISSDQEAIAAGKDQSVNPLLAIGLPVALLAAAVGVFIIALLARRRRRQPAVATAGRYPPPTSGPMDTTAPMETAQIDADQRGALTDAQPTQPYAPPQASQEQPPSAGGVGHGKQDPYEELRKLSELKDAGVISEEEFAAKKKEVLDSL